MFGVADGIIGRVTDGSAGEAGKAGQMNSAIAVDQLLQVDEGIIRLVTAGRAGLSGSGDHHLMASGLEAEKRLGPQETEPADFLASDYALEKEGGRLPFDSAKGRYRR
jgi:hypothetical protein